MSNFYITDEVIKYFLKYLKNTYISKMDEELRNYYSIINNNSTIINSLSSNLEDTTSSLATIQFNLNATTNNLQTLSAYANQLTEDINTINQTLSDQSANISTNTIDISNISELINNINTSLTNLQSTLNDCKTTLTNHSQAITTLENNNQEVNNIANTIEQFRYLLDEQNSTIDSITTALDYTQQLVGNQVPSHSQYLSINNTTNNLNFEKKKEYYSNLFTIQDFSKCEPITKDSVYLINAKYFIKTNTNNYVLINIDNEKKFTYLINNGYNLYIKTNDTSYTQITNESYSSSTSYYIYFENGYFKEATVNKGNTIIYITSNELLQEFLNTSDQTLYILKQPTYLEIEYYFDCFNYYLNELDAQFATNKIQIINLEQYNSASQYKNFGNNNFSVNGSELFDEIDINLTINRISSILLSNNKYWSYSSSGKIFSTADTNTIDGIYYIFINESPENLNIDTFNLTDEIALKTSKVLILYKKSENKTYFKCL